jgi:hypothetical protein
MGLIRRYECDRVSCPHYGEPMTHPCYEDGHAWHLVEYVPRADADRGAVLTDEERRVVVPILDGALQRWALTDDERRTLRGARNRLANGGQ